MDYQEVIAIIKKSQKSNDIVGILPGSDFSKSIISAMQELHLYKQLGTLEEVREALEKQKAKKPGEVTNGLIWWDNDGNPVWLTDHICAVCGKRIIPEYRHCPYCGQAIDWSEEKGDAG